MSQNLRARDRDKAIHNAGSLGNALINGTVLSPQKLTVSEALVLDLLAQNSKKCFVVFGHGTTDLAELLRIYVEVGIISGTPFRNEIEATHAASALRWVTGEPVAVVTSIGPGALQAVSASLVASTDGIGIWFIFGDETTHDEGDNMQQIIGHGQSAYFRMLSVLGKTYPLHASEGLTSFLRQGAVTTKGGRQSKDYSVGYFFETIVLLNISQHMPVMKDETFGPSAPIATAEAPFGGVKMPGFGREGGSEGVEEFLITKYVNARMKEMAL